MIFLSGIAASKKWCAELVNGVLILTADGQTSLIKCRALWSINIALKLHAVRPAHLAFYSISYRIKVCLPLYLSSFRPSILPRCWIRTQIEKCHEGPDRLGLCCTRFDLSLRVVLEADCTPCYVNDAFLGVSRVAVSVKWRTLPPLPPTAPPGQLTGSHCWHGKQTWSGMVWSVPPGHLSRGARQHSCPTPPSPPHSVSSSCGIWCGVTSNSRQIRRSLQPAP